jgi:prepilin-type N-terminal cleavage/methylation domain-containing protein
MRREIDENSSSMTAGRRCGFTLVELLVVIGIIAVLIAIFLPVLAKARAQANRAVCLSNIRQLGIGVLMYCNDNQGWFPTCACPDDTVAFIPYPDDWLHWQANRSLTGSAIAKYLGRAEILAGILRCPSDSFDNRKTYPSIAAGQGPYVYSYSMNDALGQNVKGAEPRGYRTKLSRWRSPSRKVMLTEGTGDLPRSFYSASWHYDAPLTRRHGIGRFHKNIPGNPAMSFGAKLGVNVSAAFLDGHADSIDQDFAYNPIHGSREAR